VRRERFLAPRKKSPRFDCGSQKTVNSPDPFIPRRFWWPKYVKNLTVSRFHQWRAMIASPRVHSRDYAPNVMKRVKSAACYINYTILFSAPSSRQVNDDDGVTINCGTGMAREMSRHVKLALELSRPIRITMHLTCPFSS